MTLISVSLNRLYSLFWRFGYVVVVVGEVAKISLGEDEVAILALKLDKSLEVPIHLMASVKSQGIICDKYIQISIEGEDQLFKAGGLIRDTESLVDIESLISKFGFESAE